MKRSLVVVLVVALFAACSTKEIDLQTPVQDNVVFFASFEQTDEDATRVYVNEDLLLRWTTDDRVSIFNKNTSNWEYRFIGETGDNTGEFSKVQSDEYMTGNAISNVVSVYPYQAYTKISEDEVITVNLPAEQHYAENTFGLGANTMVSVSEDNHLQYKSVGGYLILQLHGDNVFVSSITLKGNTGLEKLAGKASITMPKDGVPTAAMADDAVTEITLVCDTPVSLGSSAEASKEFWFVVPPLTFSNGFTVSVTNANGEVFVKSTSKSITIKRSRISKMSPVEVEMITPTVPVPDAIDLGLSVKWASFNLGASTPVEYGDYYAWGETEPYYISQEPLKWKEGKEAGYNWPSYKWCMGSEFTIIKYCPIAYFGYNGFTDDKTVLALEDDAAHVNLGGKWRMPTKDEILELLNNCKWVWTTQGGVDGRLITGPNGNSIFLPAAGCYSLYSMGLVNATYEGYYWTSSLARPDIAYGADFGSRQLGTMLGWRSSGVPVRPVYGDPAPFVPVESVSIDKPQITLPVGATANLYVTVLPDNATNIHVTWSSSDASIAKVSSDDPPGVVTGVAPGCCVITATSIDGGITATCNVTVTASSPYTVSTPEAIDLGLPSGIKWASFNLGATAPEEYGDYFAWGEIEPYYSSQDPLLWKVGKDGGYFWSSYQWCMGSQTTLTKYCYSSSYGYDGFTDTKTVLDLEDDAAHVNLGDKWRMPTDADFTELRNNCSWVWTSINGIVGRKVTGLNGNSIFLPAAGMYDGSQLKSAGSGGEYWSSSLDVEEGMPYFAWYVYLNENWCGRNASYRRYGRPVRPVCD